jgi:hypothetical protein
VRAARTLLFCLLCFFAAEFLVFHTRLYRSALKPQSTAGIVESILTAEITREVHDRNQIIMVGDSRMGFFPRVTDAMLPELGYTFRTIGVAGSSPRIWYYLLREADPTKRRYAAVIVPVENYEDAESGEDYANRMVDLNYLAGVLRWRDAWEFARSFRDPRLKFEALRGLVFRGLVYKRDFADFVAAPGKRVYEVGYYGHYAADWRYSYDGFEDSIKDVHVDFRGGAITGPPEIMAAHGAGLRVRFLEPAPRPEGRESEYLHYWLTKICDYYRDSGTRIIFIRLPRGGFVRPDQPAVNPFSSVRELSQRPGVTLAPEHVFDDLERPELFNDEVHLNGPGERRFTVELAREVRDLLGHR